SQPQVEAKQEKLTMQCRSSIQYSHQSILGSPPANGTFSGFSLSQSLCITERLHLAFAQHPKAMTLCKQK
ncbi:MAG: hypothetical protein AAF412_14570, partial [Pseudomonadota bacterium]